MAEVMWSMQSDCMYLTLCAPKTGNAHHRTTRGSSVAAAGRVVVVRPPWWEVEDWEGHSVGTK